MYIQNDWIYIVNILFSIVSVSYAFKFRSFAFIYIYTDSRFTISKSSSKTYFCSFCLWPFETSLCKPFRKACITGRPQISSAKALCIFKRRVGGRVVWDLREVFDFFRETSILEEKSTSTDIFLVAVYIEINVLFFFGMCCWVRVSWLQFYAEEKHKGTHRVCLEL